MYKFIKKNRYLQNTSSPRTPTNDIQTTGPTTHRSSRMYKKQIQRTTIKAPSKNHRDSTRS